MKITKKRLIPIIFFILLSIYIIFTIPLGFIRKNKIITNIGISYIENIMVKSSDVLWCSIETDEEIDNLINILNGYHYRKIQLGSGQYERNI